MSQSFSALARNSIEVLDRRAADEYNRRASDKYQLRVELGPYAYEGDLQNAGVVLLLSNPGFGDESAPDAHTFCRPGWPLSGHHPEAPEGTRRWHLRLLRSLIREFGAEAVARRVAKLELTPWASRSMDTKLRLPSREYILNAAADLAKRGAVLIVMRAESLWLEEPAVARHAKRYRVNNWRVASISAGNLPPKGWSDVRKAMAA